MEMTQPSGYPPPPGQCRAHVSPERRADRGQWIKPSARGGQGKCVFTGFVCFYGLQQLNSWLLCWFQYFYESVRMKINVHITMMKLGLFLFLQLKDGTLISGTPAPWSTSHALCVWPLRMRRGRSHQSSCHARGDSNRRSGPGHSPLGAQCQATHLSHEAKSKIPTC